MQRGKFAAVDAERPARRLGDECAHALPGDHEAFGAQCRDRLAHHRAAHPGCSDQFLLGRQLRARREFAARDLRDQAFDENVGQAARRRERAEPGPGRYRP
jgi:hypothetical protein